ARQTLKHATAPKHWMLDKLSVFASRPLTAPQKLKECLPLTVFLRNRKYALTGDEVKKIHIMDSKIQTNITYPAGFMDVISIKKTGEHFHLTYDTKGRFVLHVSQLKRHYKLCKMREIFMDTKGLPHLVTHVAGTIGHPDSLIKVNDTVVIDLGASKIPDFIRFDTGKMCMMIGGANLGGFGVITNRERHPGSFDACEGCQQQQLCTRLPNIFVIGKGNKPWNSLPRGKSILLLKRDKRLTAKQSFG
uniref:40S ribosomal protein S4 n=1 Tax=Loxodonta africana TaxID=9785 RepID=G3UFC9_LOXAF